MAILPPTVQPTAERQLAPRCHVDHVVLFHVDQPIVHHLVPHVALRFLSIISLHVSLLLALHGDRVPARSGRQHATLFCFFVLFALFLVDFALNDSQVLLFYLGVGLDGVLEVVEGVALADLGHVL